MFFVIKFSCTNLEEKTSTVNLSNSGVVMYLPWLWSVAFILILLILVPQSIFLTKVLTSGILFSTVDNSESVAKTLILDILLSFSVILELWSVLLEVHQYQELFCLR